jgi:FtsH-binding integral membrane protein
MDQLNLNSLRSKRAQLSSRIGKLGFEIMVALTWLFGAITVYFFLQDGMDGKTGYLFLSATLIIFSLAIWDKWDLQKIKPIKKAKTLDDILEPRLLAEFKRGAKVTPKSAWLAASKE